jgi:hypothetical protein
MRVAGHRTAKVFQRYRIVSSDDVRAALERIRVGRLLRFDLLASRLDRRSQRINDRPRSGYERRGVCADVFKTQSGSTAERNDGHVGIPPRPYAQAPSRTMGISGKYIDSYKDSLVVSDDHVRAALARTEQAIKLAPRRR